MIDLVVKGGLSGMDLDGPRYATGPPFFQLEGEALC